MTEYDKDGAIIRLGQEGDRLRIELSKAKEEIKVWKDKYRKCAVNEEHNGRRYEKELSEAKEEIEDYRNECIKYQNIAVDYKKRLEEINRLWDNLYELKEIHRNKQERLEKQFEDYKDKVMKIIEDCRYEHNHYDYSKNKAMWVNSCDLNKLKERLNENGKM